MPKLTFLVTGQTHEVPAGTKFLDFCRKNNAPHDFGCTVGSCGTCCLTLESGAENVNPATDDEKETVEMCTDVKGARLGCQLVINGDIAVRPIER
ncbi:MAG: (2Fe-2S)-binding protein [Planctomycetes bacterium]|nr:(2Fe-2S)-binding protein [Planctomycetota bacterium]